MAINNLTINPQKEAQKIVLFIKKTLQKQGFSKLAIGVSGGVDSAVCLNLAIKAIGKENILSFFLPYKKQKLNHKVYKTIDITRSVDSLIKTTNTPDKVIKGNIIARMRMIILFAKAQESKAMVCGTENRSENLLGYFTRFGDAASDIEPITHLYKTQVYQLAEYLKIPEKIIKAKPSAGLWKNQTDEGDFGFSYQIADQVLFKYFEQKKKIQDLEEEFGKEIVGKILRRIKNNLFKQLVPYQLPPFSSKT